MALNSHESVLKEIANCTVDERNFTRSYRVLDYNFLHDGQHPLSQQFPSLMVQVPPSAQHSTVPIGMQASSHPINPDVQHIKLCSLHVSPFRQHPRPQQVVPLAQQTPSGQQVSSSLQQAPSYMSTQYIQ